MSGFSVREPVPVSLFGTIVYVDGIKASAAEVIYESPTVSGSTVVTSRYRKGTRIVFRGRSYDEDAPVRLASALDSMTGEYSGFSIDYRGIRIPGCRLSAYTADDTDEGWLNVTFTVYTQGHISVIPAETEANEE